MHGADCKKNQSVEHNDNNPLRRRNCRHAKKNPIPSSLEHLLDRSYGAALSELVPYGTGGEWLLYLLGYNMSVAVWVGLIALAGLDAETGVVMLLYLDHAWDKYRSAGRMNRMADLYAAVHEGAVQRIRPKMMTGCAILFGLLPIMWSPVYQAGADVMKRIATPMIGGVVTSAILELLIYPVIYVIWRKRELPAEGVIESGALAPRSKSVQDDSKGCFVS
jgi:copper/silver efflux system protein